MVRHRLRMYSFSVAVLLAVTSGACSVLFAPNAEQCASDGDCQAKGTAFAGTRCVANTCVGVEGGTTTDGGPDVQTDTGSDADQAFACAMLPAPSPDPSKQVDISMRYTDFSSGAPPTNAFVRLCAATDSTCANARNTLVGKGPGDAGPEAGNGWVIPLDDGTVTGKIEFGFEGFFELKGDVYPQTIRSTSPALRNEKNEFDQLLLRPGEINFLANELLGKQNAYKSTDHGLVFVFARDCNQQPIANATFSTSAEDPDLVLFYIINSSPSIKDTKTDTLGRAGYLNVPPGIHTFTGYLGEGESRKKYGTGRVLVRAGAATTIAVTPTQ